MSDETEFTNEDSAQLFQLIHMFQRSAMIHMGMLPDPEGNTHYNLAEAKAGIDLLAMLQRKTTGNLDDAETRLLRGVISELQMLFVQAPERHQAAQEASKEEDETRQAFTNPREGPSEEVVGALDQNGEEE